MRHIICSFLICVKAASRCADTPTRRSDNRARARCEHDHNSPQLTMVYSICQCCTVVVLAFDASPDPVLTKFRLFWTIPFRSSHRFYGSHGRESPCRYPPPFKREEDHGGQETSHGQHLVIDGVPNAVLGSTSKFSKRLPRFSFRD